MTQQCSRRNRHSCWELARVVSNLTGVARATALRAHDSLLWTMVSSFLISASKFRIPSAVFSGAIASSLIIHRKDFSEISICSISILWAVSGISFRSTLSSLNWSLDRNPGKSSASHNGLVRWFLLCFGSSLPWLQYCIQIFCSSYWYFGPNERRDYFVARTPDLSSLWTSPWFGPRAEKLEW